MIDFLLALVHPLALALLLLGAVALDVWLIDRRFARWLRDGRDAPPPDTP